MIRRVALAGAAWLAILVAPAGGQVPGALAVETWGGASVGSFEVTYAGLEMAPGAAWGATLSWGPTERIGVYAAYAALPFRCEGGLCQGNDVSFVSRGASFGVRGQLALQGEPWAQAGILLHGFQQEWGGERVDTPTDPGIEGAVGLTWRVGRRLSVVPALHMGLLPTRAPDGVTERAAFLAARVGVRLGL
jgi:hypothetical protein